MSRKSDTGGSRRCAQCFQDLGKNSYSNRQYMKRSGMCLDCVSRLLEMTQLGHGSVASKWSYDTYYRCCRKGKYNGGNVRSVCNEGAPVVGFVPFGKVFKGTRCIVNDMGDGFVKMEDLSLVELKDKVVTTAWVAMNTLDNQPVLEIVDSVFEGSRYFQCLVESTPVRLVHELNEDEIGYLLFGDVVEAFKGIVTASGRVWIQLKGVHDSGVPVWVPERTINNESILRQVDMPNEVETKYRCVLEDGAPIRKEPSLEITPFDRIQCGQIVMAKKRVITDDGLVFVQLKDRDDAWVIERTTRCASVLIKM